MTGPLVKNVIRRAPKGWERRGYDSDQHQTAYPSVSFNVNEKHPLEEYDVSLTIKPVFMRDSNHQGLYGDDFVGHPHKEELKEMKNEIKDRYENSEGTPKNIEEEVKSEYLPFEFDEWYLELNFSTISPFQLDVDEREEADLATEVLPERTQVYIEIIVSEDKEEVIEKARELMKELEEIGQVEERYIDAKENLPHIRTLYSRAKDNSEDPQCKEIFVHNEDQLKGKSNVKYFEERLETIKEQLEIAKDVEEIVIPDE